MKTRYIIVNTILILCMLGTAFSAEPRTVDAQFMDETTSHLDTISLEQQHMDIRMQGLNDTILDMQASQTKWMEDYKQEVKRSKANDTSTRILLGVLFIIGMLGNVWHANRTNKNAWMGLNKEVDRKIHNALEAKEGAEK